MPRNSRIDSREEENTQRAKLFSLREKSLEGVLENEVKGLARDAETTDDRFYSRQNPLSFKDDRWKSELNTNQIKVFSKIGRSLNRKYGYKSSTLDFLTNSFHVFNRKEGSFFKTDK